MKLKYYYTFNISFFYLQMMDNLQCCFNEVQKEEEENHFTTCNILSIIDETCELINNQALDICKMNIEKRKSLQEKLCNDLQIVKKVVFEETDKVKDIKFFRQIVNKLLIFTYCLLCNLIFIFLNSLN